MRSEKRLLFFDFITHYGGAQRSTTILCSRLKRLYDIQIVDAYGCCKPYLADLAKNELPLHVLMLRGDKVVIGHSGRPLLRLTSLLCQIPHFLSLTRKLSATIHRLQPDLIWTNNIKALFFLSVCSYYNNAALCLYAHGWYRKPQIPWWQRALVRIYADAIFAVSNPTKKAMTSWGVNARKIDVVYAAIDFDRLKIRTLKRTNGQEKRDKPEFTILVPGSLLYSKGQHTVIGAVKLLKKSGLNRKLRVWLAGDTGVGDSSGYMQHLKTMVNDYGLGEEVKFLGWRNDIPELMSQADAMVLPTHTEGLPLTVQEAIMLKIPVITTHVGGIPDLISDGTTGHMIDIEDEPALATKIHAMVEAPGTIQRMVDEALSRYLCIFNSENQIKLFQSAVDRAMASQGG